MTSFAVEQALLLKAANAGSSITAIRVGSTKDMEALRTALAMGVDDAALVEGEDDLDSYSTAKALKGAIDKSGKKPDVIFLWKTSH